MSKRQMVDFAPGAAASGAAAPECPPDPERWTYDARNRVRHLVPVAFVARDWGVTSRRIRALLVEGRLEGVRRDNGYWEVYHPYRVVYGLRGPALNQRKKPERKAA